MSQSTPSGYKVWEPLLLAIVAVVGMVAGSKMTMRSEAFSQRPSGSGQISEIVRFIEEQYVDDIDSGELMEKAVKSILEELDPHSGYISPEEVREINEKMSGHFDGIGVQFHVLRDSVVVLFTNENGPAEKAGVRPHDRIVLADGIALTGAEFMSNEAELISNLRGPKGSELEVKVVRHGVDSMLTFKIIRDKIKIESVVAGYMLDENTGYIKINRFASTTYREFMSTLERLSQSPKFEHLVIDLRENPGGYLKEAVNILSQLFEEKGELLVYTEGDHSKRMEYKTTGKPFYEVDNIAVLIDGGSASASEIIAGALQDHDRAVIVGTQSYGKGLVQEQFSLKNGGALRLTVARYYTPSGRCIQQPYETEVALGAGKDSTSDERVYKTSLGRVVEADGGIEPDIEVSPRFDWYGGTAYVTYDQMLDFMFYGFEDHYDAEVHRDLKTYLVDFEVKQSLKADFIKYLDNQEVEVDIERLDADWERVSTMLQAMASSHRFGYEAWHKVVNINDPVVSKAMEVVEADLRATLKI